MKHTPTFQKNRQFVKFCAYGFLKNLRFYEPFIMLFFLEKGLSYLHIGVLYAIREVMIHLFEIPSGLLADVLGRRRIMAISFGFYCIAFFIFFIAHAYWVLILAMVVYACGEAFRTGTHKAMIFEYLQVQGWGADKTHYYGYTRAFSQIGSALSAIIAAVLVFWKGSYSSIFLYSTIPYIIDMFLVLSYPPYVDGKEQQSRHSITQECKKIIRSLWESITHKELIRAIANQALYSGYYKACKDFIQPMVKTFALSIPILYSCENQQRTALLTGLVFSLLYILTAYASKSSGKFSQRYDDIAKPLNVLLITGVMCGVLSAIAYIFHFSLLAIIFYMGIYYIENLRKPMGIAYVTERMNRDSMASSLSVESKAETLFAVIIALLLGFFSNMWGLGIGLLITSILVLGISFVVRLPLLSKAA